MKREVDATYSRDKSTVWEHSIIRSYSDLREWISYEANKYPKRSLMGGGISIN